MKKRNPDVTVEVGIERARRTRGTITGPYVEAAQRAMKFAFGKDPVFVREGGTIGAVLSMEQILKVPIVFMGLSLPDHGYHAPNENYDWGQAGGGIVAFAKYFEEVGGHWRETDPGGVSTRVAGARAGRTMPVVPGAAQTVPPGALRAAGQGDRQPRRDAGGPGQPDGVSGGAFVFDAVDADAEIDVFRLAGRGGLGSPRPIGDSGIGWNLVFEGGIGARHDRQSVQDRRQLDGNESSTDTISASLAAGVRFTFLEHFSVAPTFGIIYSHTENEFKARTDTGRALLAQFDGILVNWDADVITLVPSVEGRYRQRFGPMTVELTSLYRYFETQPIRRSTEALSFESHSQWWRNRLDVDFRLPLYVFGRQFRTGASFARAELFDGLEQSLRDGSHLRHRCPVRGRPPGRALGGRVDRGRGLVSSGPTTSRGGRWDRHPGEVLIAAAAPTPRPGVPTGAAPLDLRAGRIEGSAPRSGSG